MDASSDDGVRTSEQFVRCKLTIIESCATGSNEGLGQLICRQLRRYGTLMFLASCPQVSA